MLWSSLIPCSSNQITRTAGTANAADHISIVLIFDASRPRESQLPKSLEDLLSDRLGGCFSVKMDGVTHKIMSSRPQRRRAKIIGKAGVALQTRTPLK